MKKILQTLGGMLIVAAILTGAALSPQLLPVHAQNSLVMKTLQVTIGAGLTQVTTTSIVCRQVQFENNATHNIHVGDSLTSGSRGALLLPNSVGSQNFGPFAGDYLDLSQFFISGTNGDVVDLIYFQ